MSSQAYAGYIELGTSGNYRVSKIDENNKQEMISYTGSVSYYFWELSALEMSYTKGSQVVTTKFPGDTARSINTTLFEMMGLDLVLTLGGKDSLLQPYVKGGVARISKTIIREIEGISRDQVDTGGPTVVPSAGVGFKLKFTPTFSIKVGIDAWKSTSGGNTSTVDYAGRAGISWMF